MRKGTHHSPETRWAIRLEKLGKFMPAQEFARFQAAAGTLSWCDKCKRLLPVEDFHRTRRKPDGCSSSCKACRRAGAAARYRDRARDPEFLKRGAAKSKAWRDAHKGERLARIEKNSELKRRYGVTLEQFDARLTGQGNCCAICLIPFKDSRSAHVDHDHKTGIVRGILCTSCNNGLGRFRDDPALLRRAIRYLGAA